MECVVFCVEESMAGVVDREILAVGGFPIWCSCLYKVQLRSEEGG